MNVKKIYKKLLTHFGPQGWWPVFDKKENKCIYGHCKPSAFEVCVGATLTQNTTWKNVEKALANLSLRGARRRGNLSPQFILSYKNLEKLIQPAGYYNQKAKKLRIFAKWWIKIHPNPPFKKERVKKYTSPFEKGGLRGILSARQELLSLWGIGPETADSILLYAFNKPIFVIDAYTKRLCKESTIEFKTYDEYRHFFESQLPRSAKLFNEYHALIVAWGKIYSKDKDAAIKIIK
jgi:endonuclease-3 related protein